MSAEDLSRTALRIYVRILESREPVGVRELARELSIPVSTAYYSLKKLEELGLIKRSGGGYVVSRIVSPEGFIVIGRKILPRMFIYSAFFFGVSLGEIYLILSSSATGERIFILLISLVSALIFLVEGVVASRRLGLV
ncbi:MAG: helix-turn-helix domain-containing protein [Sulfolobales archaeon]